MHTAPARSKNQGALEANAGKAVLFAAKEAEQQHAGHGVADPADPIGDVGKGKKQDVESIAADDAADRHDESVLARRGDPIDGIDVENRYESSVGRRRLGTSSRARC